MRSVRSVIIAWPVSDTLASVPATVAGQDVGAEVADELVGALVLRCRGRVDGEHGGVAGGVEDRGGHRGDAGIGERARRGPAATIAWPPDVGSSTTTWIGPLNPGPKPAASWSKAMRWVVSVGALPSSGTPMRMLSAGMAMAHRAPRPTMA